MSKKKTVLLIIVALVVGIAIGVGVTLGLSYEDNNGTIAQGTVIASGSCGDDMTWELIHIVTDSDGTESNYLAISGTGSMTSCPWNTDEYRDTIILAGMDDGIETISGGAFKNCSRLTSVSMSNTMKKIGSDAFEGCSLLGTIWIPKTINSNNMTVVIKKSSITAVRFEGTKGMKSEIDLLPSTVGTSVQYNCSKQ